MRITKRQLRRIIREAEGSTKKYDDDSALRGGQSKLHDKLQKAIIDKTVEDREEHEEEERKEKNESMRVTIRRLRKLIAEALGGILFVDHGDYGYIGLEDDSGNDYSVGDLVAALLDAGITDLFRTSDGVDEKALQSILTRRDEKVQGGIERWDSDVFETYYNMDSERIIAAYAKLKGLKIQEAPSEEEYEDDGTNAFEEYYS